MPTGSAASRGTTAIRSACSVRTLAICGISAAARRRSSGDVGIGGGEGVVDDPGPGVDLGAFEFVLQAGGFEHRGGFGQGDDDDFGVTPGPAAASAGS